MTGNHGFQQFTRFNVDIFKAENALFPAHDVQHATLVFDLDQVNLKQIFVFPAINTDVVCFNVSLHIIGICTACILNQWMFLKISAIL